MLLINRITLNQLLVYRKDVIKCLKNNINNPYIKEILIFLEIVDDNLPKHNKIKYITKKGYSDKDIIEYSKKISFDDDILFNKSIHSFGQELKDIKYIGDYVENKNFIFFKRNYNINDIKYINKEKAKPQIQQIQKPKTLNKKLFNTIKEKRENNKLDVIIVSVNYNDYLSLTLIENTKIFDNITVVTSSEDILCQELCKKFGVNCITSKDILKDGLINKSIGLNKGIKSLNNPDWILVLDADIVVKDKINIEGLNKNTLYTNSRWIIDNIDDYNLFKIGKKELTDFKFEKDKGIGFFQLFNYEFKNKYPESNWGRYSESTWSDVVFKRGFNEIISLDLKVIHIGKPYQKWQYINLNKDNVEVKKEEAIFIGIASIPDRLNSLEKTISSLINQVDKIGVYLNGWGYIPKYLINDKIEIIRSEDKGDYGDAGKFYWVNNFKGYYFTCDDDIIYPNDYIKRTIKKIELYKRKAVIAFHGSIILDNFKDYYSNDSRRVLSFNYDRAKDEYVHIVGTGTIGFHTSTINVKFEDFKTPNMADVYFAKLGQEQNVSFIVQKHKKGEMYDIGSQISISRSGIYKNKTKLDNSLIQNRIVKSIKWKINEISKGEVVKNIFNILLIGRFDTYKKGGIYKSNNMMKDYLIDMGHNVYTIDSMNDSYEIPEQLDLCIVYPGDITRPDFKKAEEKMLEISNKGIKCCINMGYNSEKNRTIEIDNIFKKYLDYKSKIYILTFSEDVKLDPILEKYKHLMVAFPKTIKLLDNKNENSKFEDREGIILGDVVKLEDESIINGKSQDWIDAVKKKMPNINLYAYQQYGKKTNLKELILVPYQKDGFSEWLSKRRISICLNQKTTFEMLPVESQCVGTPVIYRDMPQSLNQWIGHTGICVNTPKEFAEMVYFLYNNKQYWEKYSILSILNSKRNDIDNISVTLEASIRKIILG
jgi:hypothetical protein